MQHSLALPAKAYFMLLAYVQVLPPRFSLNNITRWIRLAKRGEDEGLRTELARFGVCERYGRSRRPKDKMEA